MGSPYSISITNGVGLENVLNGSYDVTAAVTGFSNASILPATQDIIAGDNSYDFTIAATGELTLHVSENGTSGGTAVVGAVFYRCDDAGTTYGGSITSNASGNAVFPYVPYAATGAPRIYYKQTASDGDHEFDESTVYTTLTSSTGTVEVTNTLAVQRTFNLTDANYTGLPIVSGELTLTAQ